MVQPARMYDVALSFAGEQRGYVESVARTLQNDGIAVFYDEFEKISLWGKNLSEKLQAVYENESDYVVIFISKAWVEKAWPRHERRAIFSRMVQESRDFLLPVRFDDTPAPGLQNAVSYVQAEDHSPAELAVMIAQKLGVTPSKGKASDVPPPRMTSPVGEVVFDYSSHDGRYVIGRGILEFETQWSKAGDRSIHVYNAPPSINGIALGPREWTNISQVVNAELLDYTSSSQTPSVGQIVLFRNIHGFYAAARLLEIKDGSRSDDSDELRFQYVIQSDGSDNFTALSTAD